MTITNQPRPRPLKFWYVSIANDDEEGAFVGAIVAAGTSWDVAFNTIQLLVDLPLHDYEFKFVEIKEQPPQMKCFKLYTKAELEALPGGIAHW